MVPEKNIEQMLPEYFQGKLSIAEGELVDRWICASAENRKVAEEYCRLEQVISALDVADSVDDEAALRSVRDQIRKGDRRKKLMSLQRFAAFMTLPLLFMSLWFAWQYYRDDDSTQVNIRSAAGMLVSASLPDGSQVWLNSNSSLTYPSRFGNTREVSLEGQGFFKVEKDESRKFIVHAKGASVEVLGTEFDVEAYLSDNVVRTTLLKGSVLFNIPTGIAGERSFAIKPGERYSWDSSSGRVVRSAVNTATVSSWRDGIIILENTCLEEALRQIGNRFNVEFLVKNDNLLSQRYTGTFSGQRLEVVLEHFRRTTDIHFDYDLKGTSIENVSGRQKILVY